MSQCIVLEKVVVVYIDVTYLLERNFLTVTEKEQLEIGVGLLKTAGLLKVETVMDKIATLTMHQEASWLQIELHSSYPTEIFDTVLLLLKKVINGQFLNKSYEYSLSDNKIDSEYHEIIIELPYK